MKYILKNDTPLVKIEEEALDVDIVPSVREAISRIYLIDEPGVLSTDDGDTNVKSGDLVIRFYENRFPKKVIVVKSKDWKNNLIAYSDAIQKEKEQWANEKKSSEPCCDTCESGSVTRG